MSNPFRDILKIGPRVTALPVVHGSADFAWAVRHAMLNGNYDCLAVPIPESFAGPLETAIMQLPTPGIVTQPENNFYGTSDSESEEDPTASFVPVDPCQPVIAALRTAMGERTSRHYIDLETTNFQPDMASLPDAYALKRVPLPQFASAILPFLPTPQEPQVLDRINHMAWTLRQLSIDYKNILFVCSVMHWPWIRGAFNDRQLQPTHADPVNEAAAWSVDLDTLYFCLGELPFITGLYEQARAELAADDNLSIDGVKQLLIRRGSNTRPATRDEPKK